METKNLKSEEMDKNLDRFLAKQDKNTLKNICKTFTK